MTDNRGITPSKPSRSTLAVVRRRRFLTQLTALAVSANGLSACGGGDAVEVTVSEGGLSLSDNSLTVTVGVQATITIRNTTALPSGSWTITSPASVSVAPSSGGSVSPGNSVAVTVTASAVGDFTVQLKVGLLPAQALTISASPAPAPGTTSFSDTFSANANPIGSPWIRTATNFQAVKTANGFACGAAYTEVNDDAYAKLSTSAFSAPNDNYEVTATVRIVSPAVAPSEIELLLRMIDTSSTMQCYEVLINTSGGGELVRINGAPGSFFEIAQTNFTIHGWTGDGDRIRARVIGTNPVVVTAWHAPAATPSAWTQLFTYSDSDATRKQSGQPAMGFYQHARDGNLGNAGWADYTVVAV